MKEIERYLVGLVIAFLVCLLGNKFINIYPGATKDIAFVTGAIVASIFNYFEDVK